MKVYFNSLGVITNVDTSEDSLRQGNVGNVLKAIFDDIDNINYTATLNFTRSDGSKITNVSLLADSQDEEMFYFVFDDAWYFAKAGETTLTIFLRDASNAIVAQGQVQFNIEETDYDDDPETITDEQYDSLLASIANDKATINEKIDNGNIIEISGTSGTLTEEQLAIAQNKNSRISVTDCPPMADGSFYNRAYENDGIAIYGIEFQNSTTETNVRKHSYTIQVDLTTGVWSLVDAVIDSRYKDSHIDATFAAKAGNNVFTGTNYFNNVVGFNYTTSFAGDEYHYKNVVVTGATGYNGKLSLFYTHLYTNSKNYFVKVGVTTDQYVTYKLPYSYADVGAQEYTLATKEYVDSELATKVDKTSYTERVYATNILGEQTLLQYSGQVVSGALVKRSGNAIMVRNEPTNPLEAVHKQYVDNAIASAISSVYKPQGTKSVDELNALTVTAAMNGYVYNVSDSGTLSQGSVPVLAGDNVMILWDSDNETFSWDKLAGSVDLTPYYTKVEADAEFVNLTSTQTITGTKTFEGDLKFKGSGVSTVGQITTTSNSVKIGFGGINHISIDGGSFYSNVADYDLGSASKKWRDVYVSRYLTDGTNTISIADIVNISSNLLATDSDIADIMED